MAADTFESRGINSVIESGDPIIVNMVTNGTDIKPGMIVSRNGETADDVDLAEDDESPYGIVLEKWDTDIDTAYADGIVIPVAPLQQNRGRIRAWIFIDGTSINADSGYGAGDAMVVDASADGRIEKFDFSDNAVATDTLLAFVGILEKDVADPGANEDQLGLVSI